MKMQQIVLNIDSIGNLVDDTGLVINSGFTSNGYIYNELNIENIQDAKKAIKNVIKLKEAGFTSDEIIEMSKEKVV